MTGVSTCGFGRGDRDEWGPFSPPCAILPHPRLATKLPDLLRAESIKYEQELPTRVLPVG